MTDHILKTPWQRARGVIGRYPDEGDRYIFEYGSVDDRGIHMVGVRHPLKVTWLAEGEIVHQEVLQPWTGTGSARSDTIIEERPDGYRE